MKRNSGWQGLLQNWPIKIIALVMAVFLFAVVNYTTEVRREVQIPLKVMLPQALEATSSVPDTVELIILGDDRAVHLINPSHISAQVDFSAIITEGVSSAPVLLVHPDYPVTNDIVLKVDPEIIKIYFVTPMKTDNPEGVDLGGITL